MDRLLLQLTRHIIAERWGMAAVAYECAMELLDVNTLDGKRQLAILQRAADLIECNKHKAA